MSTTADMAAFKRSRDELVAEVERSIIAGLAEREEFVRRVHRRQGAICVGSRPMSLGEYAVYRGRIERGEDTTVDAVKALKSSTLEASS